MVVPWDEDLGSGEGELVMYHDDPKVNDIVLTIINDGNGEMCGGLDYEGRKAAGRSNDLFAFHKAAKVYGQVYGPKVFESTRATLAQVRKAAEILLAYYVEHVKECK